MEKKTAMEELIEELKRLKNSHEKVVDVSGWAATCNAIEAATNLLPKEREQIEEAFKEGAKKRFNTMLIKRDEINKSASDYYTQTYGK